MGGNVDPRPQCSYYLSTSNNKTELCLHIIMLPSEMMASFAAALNSADPSSYGTYYNRLFYSVVLTLELTKTAKHTILPAGIVSRCDTKAAELYESPHVSNDLYETTLPCVCVRYIISIYSMLSNRVPIENDDVYPSGLNGPLSAVVVLLVGDVVGHFRKSALVVPSDDEMLVEYRGVHLGLAGMEADLHRCGRCRSFPTITQSLNWTHVYEGQKTFQLHTCIIPCSLSSPLMRASSYSLMYSASMNF